MLCTSIYIDFNYRTSKLCYCSWRRKVLLSCLCLVLPVGSEGKFDCGIVVWDVAAAVCACLKLKCQSSWHFQDRYSRILCQNQLLLWEWEDILDCNSLIALNSMDQIIFISKMCRPWERTSMGTVFWVLSYVGFSHLIRSVVEYVESLVQVVIAFYMCTGSECQSILFSCVWYVLAVSWECKAHSYCGIHYNGNLQNLAEIIWIMIPGWESINTLFVGINVLHINGYIPACPGECCAAYNHLHM